MFGTYFVTLQCPQKGGHSVISLFAQWMLTACFSDSHKGSAGNLFVLVYMQFTSMAFRGEIILYTTPLMLTFGVWCS